ncbi:MAG: hypothetical protein JWO83_2429 [Caulobacteraceae bacterium]|nr:hypothetical protein [Caulobacteraceae bacterium]
MIRIVAATLSVAILLGASQAWTSDRPSIAAPVAASASAAPASASRLDSNQVVCKRQEQPGSRLGGTKVCRTRQEWADIAAASRTSVDRMQSGANLAADRH